MEKRTSMGANRTGIDMSPMHGKKMATGARELTPKAAASSAACNRIEQQYLRESDGVGSVPLPGTIKGALKSTMEKATGRHPEVFINKLGERLAFERTGTRFYESVMRKCTALADAGETLPFALDELAHIRDEELAHFRMLGECMREIGADPTAMTPDADVSAVASMGYQRALSDPRTNVPQCLNLLLELEMTDNAAWETLVTLAHDMGLDEMADRFKEAQSQEAEHERQVRDWCRQALRAEAGKSPREQH
ncbi:MAG: ferritin-like domain-containing protein [Proteobacteria bacterium]|nr:ferritin-like domain-containing protein [Pseudomonadota bacterium]